MINCDINDKPRTITRLPTLKIYRENTRTIGMKFNGVDITGAIVYVTVKKRPDISVQDETAIIKKDITEHITPLEGLTSVTFSALDTDVDPAEYQYDVKLKRSDGKQDTVGVGKFIIVAAITNRA